MRGGDEAFVKEWNLPEMGPQTPQLRSDTFVFLLIRRIWPPGDPIHISVETVVRLRSTNWVDPISIASQGRQTPSLWLLLLISHLSRHPKISPCKAVCMSGKQ